MTDMRRHSRITTTALALVALLVFYVLSIGPVEWYTSRGYASERTIGVLRTIYNPLYWMEGSETVANFTEWYISLWDPKGFEPADDEDDAVEPPARSDLRGME